MASVAMEELVQLNDPRYISYVDEHMIGGGRKKSIRNCKLPMPKVDRIAVEANLRPCFDFCSAFALLETSEADAVVNLQGSLVVVGDVQCDAGLRKE